MQKNCSRAERDKHMDIGKAILYASTPFVYAQMFLRGKWRPNVHPYRTIKEKEDEVRRYKTAIASVLAMENSGLPSIKNTECYKCRHLCQIWTHQNYAFNIGCAKGLTEEEIFERARRVADILKISDLKQSPTNPTQIEAVDPPDLFAALEDRILRLAKENTCSQTLLNQKDHRTKCIWDVPQSNRDASGSQCTDSGR